MKQTLILLFFFVFQNGYGQLVLSKDTDNINPKNIVENFDVFIKKFKSDTIFRNSRILFPVKGYNSDDLENVIELNKTIKYEWKIKMLRYYLDKRYPVDQYKTEIDKSKDQIKETISIEGSGFKIISKYILKDHKWYLNYYFYQNE